MTKTMYFVYVLLILATAHDKPKNLELLQRQTTTYYEWQDRERLGQLRKFKVALDTGR